MWREVSWSDHSPDADRSRRWAPPPRPRRVRVQAEFRGGGVGGVPRRAPPGGDGPSTSTKRHPCPLAGTGVPGGVEGRSRLTSWTSTATRGSAFEVSRGVPVSRAMTCGPAALATVGLRGSVRQGTSFPGRGTSVYGPR